MITFEALKTLGWITFFSCILSLQVALSGHLVERYTPAEPANWITLEHAFDSAYFRKTFFLTSEMDKATIVLSATESYLLYINGILVNRTRSRPGLITEAHDINRFLSPGKNVISIAVSTDLRDITPALSARLIFVRGREETVLPSDTSWRGSLLPEKQARGKLPWYAPTFNATHWRRADATERKKTLAEISQGAPEWVYRYLELGDTLTGITAGGVSTRFSRRIDISYPAVESAWLAIEAPQPYSLTINDKTINGDATLRAAHLLDVGEVLHAGSNDVSITVTHLEEKASLRAGLIVKHRLDYSKVITDTNWSLHTATSNKSPVVLIKPSKKRALLFTKNSKDMRHFWLNAGRFFRITGYILVTTMLTLIVGTRLFSGPRSSFGQSVPRLPFCLGTLLAIVALLLCYSPAISLTQMRVASVIVSLSVLSSLFWIWLETYGWKNVRFIQWYKT